MALFAEKFIRGAESGALSVINIIDGIGGGGPEREMPPFSMGHLMVFINLWADKTKGRYALKLRPQAPSGLYDDAIELSEVNFVSTSLGVDHAQQMPPYELTEEGTYWFDVLLAAPGQDDDEAQLLTRMPFTLHYQQTVTLRAP